VLFYTLKYNALHTIVVFYVIKVILQPNILLHGVNVFITVTGCECVHNCYRV